MKSALYLTSLFLGFFATAQTIENAEGVSDPYKAKVVGYVYTKTYNATEAYTYFSTTNEEGKTVMNFGRKLFEIKSDGTNNGLKSPYYYIIYSKNGTELSRNTMTREKFIRIFSILQQSKKEHYYSSFPDESCHIKVEIDRATLSLTKITPTCDDLE